MPFTGLTAVNPVLPGRNRFTIPLSTGETEYSVPFVTGLRGLTLRNLSNAEVRFAFVTGRVAVLGETRLFRLQPYEQKPLGMLDGSAGTTTIYFASELADAVVQLEPSFDF